MVFVASAPGKNLLLGGYAVIVRPFVSLITGVDKRAYSKAEKLDANKIVFDIPRFNLLLEGTYENNKIILQNEKPEAGIVKQSTQIALNYLQAIGVNTTGVKITTTTDSAFGSGTDKSGLGGSAAISATTVAAVFGEFGLDVKKYREQIHKLAQIAHAKAQGKLGSGFDVAAAVYATCSYTRFSPDLVNNFPNEPTVEQVKEIAENNWDYIISSVEIPKQFVVAQANLVGGSTSTAEMIKLWRAYEKQDKAGFDSIMNELNDANKAAIAALAAYNKSTSEQNLLDFKKKFVVANQKRKELGVKCNAPIETDEHSKLISESMQNGALVATLPGAGGDDSIFALCLNQSDKQRLEQFWSGYSEKKIEVLDIGFSNEGLKQSSVQEFEEIRQSAKS